MDIFTEILLVVTGLVAGLIDSVAGGGGLITVPLLSVVLGPGSIAVGTNKIAGTCSSLFALIVYLRGGHVSIKGTRAFAVFVGLGAILGAQVSTLVPPEAYRYILIVICPVILWIVYKKDLWIRHEIDAHVPHTNRHRPLFLALGFGCGFYDGIAGPGGGTLMFLSLFLVARIPLLNAMATAKIANLTSASLSLASFAYTGHVRWLSGAWVGIGISVGAVIGATYATRNTGPVARAALLSLATILLIRLIIG